MSREDKELKKAEKAAKRAEKKNIKAAKKLAKANFSPEEKKAKRKNIWSHIWKFFRQLAIEIFAGALIAIGIYNFAVNANFPVSGFSGISLILYKLFHFPMGLSTMLMNIPVAILCYKLIGKRFFFSSIRCMIVSSLIVDYLAPLLPTYDGDRLLAAICCGVFSGLGYTLIYMQNSSTGGTDFIIMAVKALNPHLGIGRITFVTDGLIILVGGLLFSDIDGIIYGVIGSYIIALIADKLMYGINSGKMTLIVTDQGRDICNVIDDTCGRGSTIIQAEGGYKGDNREVVMCACSDKEMYGLQKAIKEKDPDAFMIVLESNEVHGEGFKTLHLGEKEQ